MIILATFLAGMSFLIAVAACHAIVRERTKREQMEKAFTAICDEQAKLLLNLSVSDSELEKMIRAVAAASVPPTFPSDQSKVFISVPGPRTAQ